ncbi:hypothetical protein CsatA_028515 [Cannabis sativa]
MDKNESSMMHFVANSFMDGLKLALGENNDQIKSFLTNEMEKVFKSWMICFDDKFKSFYSPPKHSHIDAGKLENCYNFQACHSDEVPSFNIITEDALTQPICKEVLVAGKSSNSIEDVDKKGLKDDHYQFKKNNNDKPNNDDKDDGKDKCIGAKSQNVANSFPSNATGYGEVRNVEDLTPVGQKIAPKDLMEDDVFDDLCLSVEELRHLDEQVEKMICAFVSSTCFFKSSR